MDVVGFLFLLVVVLLFMGGVLYVKVFRGPIRPATTPKPSLSDEPATQRVPGVCTCRPLENDMGVVMLHPPPVYGCSVHNKEVSGLGSAGSSIPSPSFSAHNPEKPKTFKNGDVLGEKAASYSPSGVGALDALSDAYGGSPALSGHSGVSDVPPLDLSGSKYSKSSSVISTSRQASRRSRSASPSPFTTDDSIHRQDSILHREPSWGSEIGVIDGGEDMDGLTTIFSDDPLAKGGCDAIELERSLSGNTLDVNPSSMRPSGASIHKGRNPNITPTISSFSPASVTVFTPLPGTPVAGARPNSPPLRSTHSGGFGPYTTSEASLVTTGTILASARSGSSAIMGGSRFSELSESVSGRNGGGLVVARTTPVLPVSGPLPTSTRRYTPMPLAAGHGRGRTQAHMHMSSPGSPHRSGSPSTLAGFGNPYGSLGSEGGGSPSRSRSRSRQPSFSTVVASEGGYMTNSAGSGVGMANGSTMAQARSSMALLQMSSGSGSSTPVSGGHAREGGRCFSSSLSATHLRSGSPAPGSPVSPSHSRSNGRAIQEIVSPSLRGIPRSQNLGATTPVTFGPPMGSASNSMLSQSFNSGGKAASRHNRGRRASLGSPVMTSLSSHGSSSSRRNSMAQPPSRPNATGVFMYECGGFSSPPPPPPLLDLGAPSSSPTTTPSGKRTRARRGSLSAPYNATETFIQLDTLTHENLNTDIPGR